MLVAELTAEGWVLVIGAVFLGFAKIASMILDYHREKLKRIRDEVVADRVALVAEHQEWARRTLDAATRETAQKLEDVRVAAVEAAAQVAEELARTTRATDRKLEGIAATGDAVHTLVNDRYGIALRTILSQAEALAKGGGEEAERAAVAARAALAEHDQKQRVVDSQRPEG